MAGGAAMTFARDDVLKVARAMVSHATDYWTDRSERDRESCNFCNGDRLVNLSKPEHCRGENFPHQLHCPVLVAQDLLT